MYTADQVAGRSLILSIINDPNGSILCGDVLCCESESLSRGYVSEPCNTGISLVYAPLPIGTKSTHERLQAHARTADRPCGIIYGSNITAGRGRIEPLQQQQHPQRSNIPLWLNSIEPPRGEWGVVVTMWRGSCVSKPRYPRASRFVACSFDALHPGTPSSVDRGGPSITRVAKPRKGRRTEKYISRDFVELSQRKRVCAEKVVSGPDNCLNSVCKDAVQSRGERGVEARFRGGGLEPASARVNLNPVWGFAEDTDVVVGVGVGDVFAVNGDGSWRNDVREQTLTLEGGIFVQRFGRSIGRAWCGVAEAMEGKGKGS